jgi:hypothetical protein
VPVVGAVVVVVLGMLMTGVDAAVLAAGAATVGAAGGGVTTGGGATTVGAAGATSCANEWVEDRARTAAIAVRPGRTGLILYIMTRQPSAELKRSTDAGRVAVDLRQVD